MDMVLRTDASFQPVHTLHQRWLSPLPDNFEHDATFIATVDPPAQEETAQCHTVTINLTVARANILTLQQPSATRPGSGTSITRQTLLMQQFHAKGCHIVGVQETRHKHIIGGNNKWYHIVGHPATSQGTDSV